MALDLSAVASRLFANLGNAEYVKIRRTTGATFDPVEGTTTGGTVSVIPVKGIVTRIDSDLLSDTRVKSTDKMILLDNGVEPLYTDLIDFGGVLNTVVIIEEVNHAGTTQLWKVVVRG